MASGIHFVDILVSEITMLAAMLLFLFCAAALLIRRKTISRPLKTITVAVLAATGVYLAFILWLVIMWG